MIVRQFRESGMDAFRAFLGQARQESTTPLPLHLLEDNAFSEAIVPIVRVDPQNFATRREAAEYLQRILAPLPEHEVTLNAGLWTWLSLFYFDQVCPIRKGKRTLTKNDYTYVFEPKNSRHYYRHLLFTAWRVLQVAPVHNRLFLDTSLASLDKVTTEVMKRLFLIRIPCIFEVLDRLYWDEQRGRSRRNIVDMSTIHPGDLVHRLPIRIRQLEKTYDLHVLSADQLLDLLGDEFRRSVPIAQSA